MKMYFKRLWDALLGRDTVVYKTEIVQVNQGKELMDKLNKTFPVQVHEKGWTLEDHAVQSGEQKVIRYLRNILK